MELRNGTAEQAGMLPDRIDRVRDLCAGWVKSGHTTAIVPLVARRGVICLHEAFGQLRPESDSPALQTDSIFPIMSITKPMTATLAMQLVEEGLLGLNRPVRDYLAELSGEGTEEILVHHLLTHTSGFNMLKLIQWEMEQGDVEIGRCPPTQHPRVHERLARLWAAPLWKPPGAEMSYSNHGFTLLAEIVRRVSERPIADLAAERLFGPLGMKDSYYSVPESARTRVVKRPPDAPFAQALGPIPGMDSREFETLPAGGGGVFSTAADLARFGQTFLNGGASGSTRILSRAAAQEMTRNQIPGLQVQDQRGRLQEASYGYGWFIRGNEKFRYWDGSLASLGGFHHQGGGGTFLWVDRPNELVGVYLSIPLRERGFMEVDWNGDLFENAVTAAVAD